MQGKSQLGLEPTDGEACRLSVAGRGKSEHGDLISPYLRHLLLRSTVQSDELEQEVQRASLIFHFSTKPLSLWQRHIMVKQGLLETNFAANGVIFQPLFNRVIHHDDKIKPKKLSSFTSSV